jgi:hypothetical protein
MKSHLESGTAKRAKSIAKPAAARTSKAAKDASAKPAKKSDGRSKVEKEKLIRDGFTIPESEYGLIAAIKKRCLSKGMAVKKSEVLRAAIISFAAQSDAAVTKALKAVEVLKTGRPPGTR